MSNKYYKMVPVLLIAAVVVAYFLYDIDGVDEGAKVSNGTGISPSLDAEIVKNPSESRQLVAKCPEDSVVEDAYAKIRSENDLIRKEVQHLLSDVDPKVQQEFILKNNLHGFDPFWREFELVPPINPQRVGIQEFKNIQQFLRLLKSQQYDGIVALLRNGNIPVNAGLDGNYMIDLVLKVQPEINIANLTALLQAGARVNLNTLYVATKEGIEPEKISLLQSYLSENNVQTIWRSKYGHVSLASVAARMKRPNLTRFWWKQGSPLVDLTADLNAALQIPWLELDQKQTIEFVNIFSESGIQMVPIYPFHYTRLAAILDRKQLELFKPLPDVEKIPVGELDKFKLIFNKLDDSKKSLQRLIACNDALLKKQKLFIAMAAGDTMSYIVKKMYDDISVDGNSDSIDALDNALNKKQWDEVIRILSGLELSEKNADIFYRAYFSMLENYADYEYLKQFVDFSPIPSEDLLHAAAVFSNSRLANLLAKKGADLHHLNKQGFSYLQIAAMNSPDLGNNMIDFLLEAGVSPFEGRGADALTILLQSAHKRNMSVNKDYIQLFKKYGITNIEKYKTVVYKNDKLTEKNRQELLNWLQM